MRAPLSLIALALASLLDPGPGPGCVRGRCRRRHPDLGGGRQLCGDQRLCPARRLADPGQPGAAGRGHGRPTPAGSYVGAWASNVDFTAAGDEDDGIDLEFRPLAIGWSGEVGGNAELDVLPACPTQATATASLRLHRGTRGKLDPSPRGSTSARPARRTSSTSAATAYMNAGVSLPLGITGFDVTAQVGHHNLKRCRRRQLQRDPAGHRPQPGPLRARPCTSSYGGRSGYLVTGRCERARPMGRVALMLTWAF